MHTDNMKTLGEYIIGGILKKTIGELPNTNLLMGSGSIKKWMKENTYLERTFSHDNVQNKKNTSSNPLYSGMYYINTDNTIDIFTNTGNIFKTDKKRIIDVPNYIKINNLYSGDLANIQVNFNGLQCDNWIEFFPKNSEESTLFHISNTNINDNDANELLKLTHGNIGFSMCNKLTQLDFGETCQIHVEACFNIRKIKGTIINKSMMMSKVQWLNIINCYYFDSLDDIDIKTKLLTVNLIGTQWMKDFTEDCIKDKDNSKMLKDLNRRFRTIRRLNWFNETNNHTLLIKKLLEDNLRNKKIEFLG